jgi:hypothetical protein
MEPSADRKGLRARFAVAEPRRSGFDGVAPQPSNTKAHERQGSKTHSFFAGIRRALIECQRRLQGDGLFPAEIRRNLAQLPDLWERGLD